MKITAFDDLFPRDIATGGTWMGTASGSNSGASGGDITGEPGDFSVVRLRSVVSIASNAGSNAVGSVLTTIQSSPWVATFAVSSNTAAGSNSTRVSEASLAGVAATFSPSDHQHDGIGTVTASSSNTMQRGTLNLRPGTNVTFGLTDSDSDGEFDTLTINGAAGGGGSALTVEEADGTPSVAATKLILPNGTVSVAGTEATYTPAAGGGITQAVVGYDTAGGTWEGMTSYRVRAKKITLATACLVTDIEAYVRNSAAGTDDQVEGLSVAIYGDVAGTPGLVIAYSSNPATSVLMDSAPGATGDDVARWLGVPIGKWLAAGDYWLAVAALEVVSIMQIAYDGSGSDRYYTAGGAWFADWGYYAPSTTSNKYSIRANTIR